MPEPSDYRRAFQVSGAPEPGDAGPRPPPHLHPRSHPRPHENSQTDDTAYCRDLSKRADRALWRAVHYAPPALRSPLFALDAFAAELNRILAQVREPILGRLRLAWWQEAILRLTVNGKAADDIEADDPPLSRYAHPVTGALMPVIKADPRITALLLDMITATGRLLDPGDLTDRATIAQYFIGTHGAAACARLYMLDNTISKELVETTRALAGLYGFWHSTPDPGYSGKRLSGAGSSEKRSSGKGVSGTGGSVEGSYRSRMSHHLVEGLFTASLASVDWPAERNRFDHLSCDLFRLSPRISPRLMPVFAPFSLIPLRIKQTQAFMKRRAGMQGPRQTQTPAQAQIQARMGAQKTGQDAAGDQYEAQIRDRKHASRRSLLLDHILMTRAVLRGRL